MKQKLALFIAILLLITLVPFSALAAATYSVGNGQTLNLTTGALTATQSGAHITTYAISDGDTISVAPGATATITGSKNVMVSCGSGVKLTITNLNINVSGFEDACALAFTGTGNTLTLVGVSTLESSEYMQGIRVEVGTDLTIGSDSDGEITANGGRNGAGIGGGYNVWPEKGDHSAGNITITGGIVKANGGSAGAGIGGGWHGAGGNITITGGKVTAKSEAYGAGIGGGDYGAAGDITISGGTVTATGGSYSAGIGGGRSDPEGGRITITGGTVTATGGGSASTGIGGGRYGAGGTIEITGGIVTAKGGSSCTGIGSGWYGSSWDIDITGGEVYADGDNNNEAMDIGHSRGSGYDDLYISGNAVVFTKDLNLGIGIVLTTDYHELHWQESIVESSSYGTAYGYTHIPDDWSGTAYAYKKRTYLLIDDAYIDFVSTNIDSFNSTITDVNKHPYLEKIDIDTTQGITIKDSNTTARSIQIEGIRSGVQLTIEDLTLDVSGTQSACALAFTGTGNTLTLVGESVLTSWGTVDLGGKPGIRVESNTALTIESASGGKVTANGGYFSAGIGGGASNSGGYTSITSGTVVANGGEYGAGIGGGMNGYSGSVNISGGNVYASGDDSSDGVMDIGYSKNGYAGVLDQFVISGDAAVFLKNDLSIPPATSTHTHELVTTVIGNQVHGVSANGWVPNFGVYMRLCTLDYSANQGSGTVPESVTQHMGTTTTLGDNSNLSRAKYTLGDWNTQEDGNGDSYAVGDDIVIDGDITLFAEWNEIDVTSVTLSSSSETMTHHDTLTLTSTVLPNDATYPTVTWSSDNESAVTVDQSGFVTAVGVGSATIRATADGVSGTCDITVEKKAVTSVTLSSNSETMTHHDTLTLSATVLPNDATYPTVTWSSDNESAVTVDQSGFVTAVGVGNATITATADGVSDTCDITVNKKPVTSITLSSNTETMTHHDTLSLTATVLPNDATNPTVTWMSDNTSAVTVDQSGFVTAVGVGSSTITATADGVSDTCDITVEKKAVTSVTLSSNSETMTHHDTLTLTATVLPDNATYPAVIWSSDNTSVATVDQSGNVEAVGVGSATITATADGASDTCDITVEKKAVTSVTLSSNSETMTHHDTLTLTATVLPDNATYPAVTWSSDNTSVATVDQSGFVTAVGVGSATITATADGVSDTCDITVEKKAVTSVTLSSNSETMTHHDTLTLTATVAPNNATYPDVIWSSDNESAVTVDQSGNLEAVGVGSATITATADGVSDTCDITVDKKAVTSVTLSSNSETMTHHDTLTLTATVLPSDATYPDVTWLSDNTSAVTVDQSGFVTAVGVGSATITATADGVSDTCDITVEKKAVTSVTLSSKSETMTHHDTLTLTATVAPNNATYPNVTWLSDNESVVTVDQSGNVEAVALGSATITATADGVSDTCDITVEKKAVTSVTLSSNSETMTHHDTLTLTATVLPSDATYPDVTWSSDNTSVATADQSGNVEAVGVGSVTITATADGISDTCDIIVNKNQVTSVIVSSSSETMIHHDTVRLTATVLPNDATYPGVTWTSSDTSVATVDDSGKIAAVGVGSATITAKADGKTGTCEVTVNKKPVTNVTLSSTSKTVYKGSTFTLTAEVSPSDATYPSVSWSSSNSNVATVDANGKVTAVGVGSATIIAKADGKTGTCAVTVKSRPTSTPTPTPNPTEATDLTESPEPTQSSEPMESPEPTQSSEPMESPEQSDIPGTGDQREIVVPVIIEENDGGTSAVIEIDVSDLPEGTESIQMPSGEVIEIGSEQTIRVKVSKDDIEKDGTVELITLGEEDTPLAVVEVQIEQAEPTAGSVWHSIWSVLMWILIGIAGTAAAAVSLVFIFKKKNA